MPRDLPEGRDPDYLVLGQQEPRSSLLPPLLTETTRCDRFRRKTSIKSTPASPCQREGRQFESGLVLPVKSSPVSHRLAGLFCFRQSTLSAEPPSPETTKRTLAT